MALFNRNRGEEKAEMTFIDHLEELRQHIIRSVIAILVMAAIIFIYRDWVFDNVITGPINPDFISYRLLCDFSHWAHMGDALCMPPVTINMQTTTFGGQFLSSISLALIGGILIAFPYIFWEFWRFIKPALKDKELKNTRFIIFWVSFFFFTGAAFGYFLLGPFTFNFLGSFTLGTKGVLETRPTLTDYLDNLTNLILGCGIAFELPVFLIALNLARVLSGRSILRPWRYAIFGIVLFSAIATPTGDPLTLFFLAGPLIILYLAAGGISLLVDKARAKRNNSDG
mgnify:CR=1 FL=1